MGVRFKYFIYGFIFGLCFPVMAIGFQLFLSKLSFSLANLGIVHEENPLIYMIDSAPLFLGFFAYIGGVSKHKSLMLLKEFKGLAEDLSQSNNQLNLNSEKIFSELLKSSKEIEDMTFNLIQHNEELYFKNTENRSAAQDLSKSSTVLLNSTAELISLNRELKDSNDLTFTEVEEFKTLIGQLSSNYSKITEVGNEIKALSINSSIEASKYGEAGKSFSVIARQIKTLSEFITDLNLSTQKITGSVSRQINDISGYVRAQNQKLQTILEIIENVEIETATNKNNLTDISQNIEHSIEIQDVQKVKFRNVSSEIDQLSRKKTDLIENLKEIIENNSGLIDRISSL